MTDYPLTLLYDGACPICRFEMDRLREQDGLKRLAFVDIANRAHALFARHRYSVSGWVMPWLAPPWARRTARRMQACAEGGCPASGQRPGGAS